MVNQDYESSNMGTPKFEMQELPQEIGKVVYGMKVGEISKPFTMLTNKQKEVVAIVKLKARTEGHKANLADDFQALKAIVEAKKREELLNDWITKKQKQPMCVLVTVGGIVISNIRVGLRNETN